LFAAVRSACLFFSKRQLRDVNSRYGLKQIFSFMGFLCTLFFLFCFMFFFSFLLFWCCCFGIFCFLSLLFPFFLFFSFLFFLFYLFVFFCFVFFSFKFSLEFFSSFVSFLLFFRYWKFTCRCLIWSPQSTLILIIWFRFNWLWRSMDRYQIWRSRSNNNLSSSDPIYDLTDT